MKKLIFLFAIIGLLASCKKESQSEKYKEIYNKWSSEMDSINNGHDTALSIMDGFQQKIENHKKSIREFGAYIDSTKLEIATLKGKSKQKEVTELEGKILEVCNKNLKKHEHFGVFLNNLSALQGIFESKSFALTALPDEAAIKKFTSLDEAVTFWTGEMAAINEGHDKGLGIIKELKGHIHHHQKEIAGFTQKIEELKGKADIAAKDKKNEELKTIEADLENNYTLNSKKHAHFLGFLENLKTVQQQFEN